MGTWGTAISSNDTYADVYADFFDQYNEGVEVEEITANLIKSNLSTTNDHDDRNNFWFALAKAQWECKQLIPDVFSKIKSIVDDRLDIIAWEQSGANAKDLEKRKIVLNKFLQELSQERVKARPRKKPIIQKPIFSKGDCLVFKLNNGNYGGAVVLDTKLNTKYASNLVVTTNLNQLSKPTTHDLINSSVLIKNFGQWDNKPCINWIISIKNRPIEHLFEIVGNIDVEIVYKLTASEINKFGYGFSRSDSIILYADRQFEHELVATKPSLAMPVKKLITKNKWKFW